ncbi:MAG TPA: DUF1028 domain-containing protein [Candidatus Deferrimicrobium sp.]|nr:DUF1028 domain-containing protein [Candidatus Deferrimicrobium sp.]
MLKNISVILTVSTFIVGACSQPCRATFSIVAVDTVTGEIGGAGASCIDNCQIINDIIKSVGAVHTQAYWLQQNQNNAHARLQSGLTPDSIIGWLVTNDAQANPGLRQYGVVTLAGPGSSAAYTGIDTDPWTGHLTGPGYAIQGNILLGSQIIDTMKTVFLATTGHLEEKLMAALEAAKVPGADTRCLPLGKSAISAFIKVVRPQDGGAPYLYQVVYSTSGAADPIDSLRVLYDAWKVGQGAHADSSTISVTPEVLEADGLDTAVVTIVPKNAAGKTPVYLDSVKVSNSGSGQLSVAVDNGDGTFTVILTAPLAEGVDTLSVGVGAYGMYTVLTERPSVMYYTCGNADGLSGPGGPVDVADLTFLVAYLFGGGSTPPLIQAANVDGVIGPGGPIDVADLTHLVGYLFGSGPAPVC